MVTGRPTGMWISLAVVMMLLGVLSWYWTSHHHWCAVTAIETGLSSLVPRASDVSDRAVANSLTINTISVTAVTATAPPTTAPMRRSRAPSGARSGRSSFGLAAPRAWERAAAARRNSITRIHTTVQTQTNAQ
jgi:hypothetical protein